MIDAYLALLGAIILSLLGLLVIIILAGCIISVALAISKHIYKQVKGERATKQPDTCPHDQPWDDCPDCCH